MDGTRYVIRPCTDADYDARSRISRRVRPDDSASADELRHFDRFLEGPGRFHQFLVAEDRGSKEVVATASIFHSPWAFDPDGYGTGVSVDPDHQGRGVGRQLFGAVEEIAHARRARLLTTRVRADQPRSVRFFERSGFVERRRVWTSILDLTLARLPERARSRPEWASEGVEFTTAAREGADRPEVRERVYRLWSEAMKDAPVMGPRTAYTFEQFVEIAFGGPGFLPEGMLLARVGDEYVAISTLATVSGQPDTLHIGFTGTLRPYRGRGLASELKREGIELARARGYRYLRTNNDSANQAIWSINEKLGFRQQQVDILGEKELAPSG